jgi:hypothetical protein
MPPNVRGGPQDRQPGSRPNADSVAAIASEVAYMVTDDQDSKRRAPRRSRPLAFASMAAPGPGRDWYHIMYPCTACGHTHFGRSPVELTTGPRRARCGRLVYLVIARVYRGPDEGAAA